MPRLIVSAAALADLKRLRAFLRAKNPRAAKEAGLAITEALQGLIRYPEMGRLLEGGEDSLRELFIRFGGYGYMAKYRYRSGTAEAVIVLAIKHGREETY